MCILGSLSLSPLADNVYFKIDGLTEARGLAFASE